MSATGRGAERQILDFYSTPAWATDAILDVLLPRGGAWTSAPPYVLEPATGDGAIVERLLARGVPHERVKGQDISGQRAAACADLTGVVPLVGDFTSRSALDGRRFELIITNPPFAQAEAFFRRSLQLLATGGVVALLLRLNWLGSRARVQLHRAHPADLYVLPKRPAFGGAKGTDSCEYAWFVWGLGTGGRWSLLELPAEAA